MKWKVVNFMKFYFSIVEQCLILHAQVTNFGASSSLAAMMDVTKQRDLSGFYRHFLNQATGEEAVPSNLDTPATKKEAETRYPHL